MTADETETAMQAVKGEYHENYACAETENVLCARNGGAATVADRAQRVLFWQTRVLFEAATRRRSARR